MKFVAAILLVSSMMVAGIVGFQIDAVRRYALQEKIEALQSDVDYYEDKNNERTVWEGFYLGCFNVRYYERMKNPAFVSKWTELREGYRKFLDCQSSLGPSDRKRLWKLAADIERTEPPADPDVAFAVQSEMDAAIGFDKSTKRWTNNRLDADQRRNFK